MKGRGAAELAYMVYVYNLMILQHGKSLLNFDVILILILFCMQQAFCKLLYDDLEITLTLFAR